MSEVAAEPIIGTSWAEADRALVISTTSQLKSGSAVVGCLVAGDAGGINVPLNGEGDETHPQLLHHHGVNNIVVST